MYYACKKWDVDSFLRWWEIINFWHLTFKSSRHSQNQQPLIKKGSQSVLRKKTPCIVRNSECPELCAKPRTMEPGLCQSTKTSPLFKCLLKEVLLFASASESAAESKWGRGNATRISYKTGKLPKGHQRQKNMLLAFIKLLCF